MTWMRWMSRIIKTELSKANNQHCVHQGVEHLERREQHLQSHGNELASSFQHCPLGCCLPAAAVGLDVWTRHPCIFDLSSSLISPGEVRAHVRVVGKACELVSPWPSNNLFCPRSQGLHNTLLWSVWSLPASFPCDGLHNALLWLRVTRSLPFPTLQGLE